MGRYPNGIVKIWKKKSKKLSPKVFQIDQFNLILYHGCRYIAHYPCYWKIPQHVGKQRKTTQNVVKMKKDTKAKKLPDSFKKYNYFRFSELKIIRFWLENCIKIE